jgi:hypothetical protein
MNHESRVMSDEIKRLFVVHSCMIGVCHDI